MSTRKETVEFIVYKLGHPGRFHARAMFGEYALYADSKVVALICDDTLFVKVTPESSSLEEVCEQGAPYDGAKLHYVVGEEELELVENLPKLLLDVAAGLPAKKAKKK